MENRWHAEHRSCAEITPHTTPVAVATSTRLSELEGELRQLLEGINVCVQRFSARLDELMGPRAREAACPTSQEVVPTVDRLQRLVSLGLVDLARLRNEVERLESL